MCGGAVSLIAISLCLTQMPQNHASLCHERLPLDQCGRAAKLVGLTVDEMALLGKVVVKRSVYGREFLQRLHSSETLHHTLFSAQGQVAVLDPIVLPAPHLAAVEIAQCAHRGRVGSQPVGHDLFSPAETLQCFLQEDQSRRFVALFRNKALENLALVIDRAPQVMALTVDFSCAALRVTNTSSTCHRPCRNPRIRDTRWRRISEANIGAKRFHQNRTVS